MLLKVTLKLKTGQKLANAWALALVNKEYALVNVMGMGSALETALQLMAAVWPAATKTIHFL